MLRVFLVCTLVSGIVGVAVAVALDRFNDATIDVSILRDAPLTVAIGGAVAVPDVYTLSVDSRLNDLVTAAGGFTDDADTTGLNLAARIGDGETIHIPSIASQETVGNASPTAERVNLNTASATELDQLPGIGEVLASRIIEYREQFGPFTSIDQLSEIEGISPGTVDELRPFVTIDG